MDFTLAFDYFYKALIMGMTFCFLWHYVVWLTFSVVHYLLDLIKH